MAQIKLKVTSSELKGSAADIQNQIKALENDWKRIEQVVKASKGYWSGDASNAHQDLWQESKEDIEKALKRLREHPQDLLKMADIYEETESKAAALANALPGDIIF
ncbi:MAG: WXG100 family type VII secretion target [Lachnospiraceae bacterium]|nr:WXG100 family type VII secretion target [Lachnospiraceae bacterium]